MTLWQPGMRCVCVTAVRRHTNGDETLPVKGQRYTVRELDNTSDFPCIRLNEIVNDPRDYGEGVVEASFDALAFVPDLADSHLRERVPA